MRGLIGPDELPRALVHARDLGGVLELGDGDTIRCLDLGSGGGLPGLVLAHDWSASHWTLLDTSRRATDFLSEAVDTLGLAHRVSVVNARAEAAGRDPVHAQAYGVVTARSVAPPAVTAEYAAPLLSSGGRLLVSEPPDAEVGQRWSAEGLSRLGLGEPLAVHMPRAVVISKVSATPARFPRKAGIAAKRPLW